MVAGLFAAWTMPGSTPSVLISSSAPVEPLELALHVPVAGDIGRREVRERAFESRPGEVGMQ